MKDISNETITAYIGLGSNLEDPIAQINSARLAINQIENVKELTFSSLYHSLPMGPQDQPDYTNAVMGVITTLEPLDLLRSLQTIENAQGRVRKGERWGARTLDLDILLYGDEVLDHPDLKVPHIGLTQRSFVLYPLQEIAPDLLIPGKAALADLVALCPLDGLKRLD
ncbi:MAG: 2-amino-4-hydroxy-6-hydroxymethyldihydropteridine diphosphokinase [Methylococcales bacterium]|nr:2-amino-4-hydroxy-6-hydroxymethyldihydropteridine diphosphokinase [Methylococcales bacterium]